MDDNRIDMPQSAEVKFKRASRALKKGDLDSAYQIFKDLYINNPSVEVTLMYFRALYELEYVEEGIELAEKHSDIFSNGDAFMHDYIKLLINANQFIKAEAMIGRAEKISVEEVGEHHIVQLKNALDKCRYQYEKARKAAEETIIKQLYSIADASLIEQMNILSESTSFSNPQINEAYKQILVNPFANEITKTMAINYLLEKESDATVSIKWFGENRQLALETIDKIDDNQTIQSLTHELQDKLVNNPSLYQLIQQELTVHMMLVYPYIDEVVKDKEKWLEFYLDQYDPNYEKDSVNENSEMAQWFETLSNPIE